MATLNKFGVPMGGGNGRGGLLQLKYGYRFRVRVVNFGPIAGGMELTQQVESVSKPNIDTEEIEVNSYNSKAWFAGKHTWGTIDLVVKDDITNAVSTLVGHQMQKQLNHFEQTGFVSGTNYKFVTLIEVMDGGNDVVLEAWTLEGCWLKSVDYGDMNYSQSEYQTITMTIRFDNATQADGLMTLLPERIAGVMI